MNNQATGWKGGRAGEHHYEGTVILRDEGEAWEPCCHHLECMPMTSRQSCPWVHTEDPPPASWRPPWCLCSCLHSDWDAAEASSCFASQDQHTSVWRPLVIEARWKFWRLTQWPMSFPHGPTTAWSRCVTESDLACPGSELSLSLQTVGTERTHGELF